jgi:zinc protease
LRAITLDDVRAFYAAHYTPDRLTIAMTGDFDPQQAKAWIEKYFGPMAPGLGLTEQPRYIPEIDPPRTVEFRDPDAIERIWFAWATPGYANRDQAALSAAATLLGAETSPLVKALNKKLSQGVSIETEEWQDASKFTLIVSQVPGAKLADVEATGMAELERFARDGPNAEELARFRHQLELSQLAGLEKPFDFAHAMQTTQEFYGGIEHWGDWLARSRSVTGDEMRAAVKRWLVDRKHLTVHALPLNAVPPSEPAPVPTPPPPVPPVQPYRAPRIQSARLPNGFQIFVVERHDLPMVAAEVRLRAGLLASPDKPIVAALAADLAAKGTRTRKAVDIQAEADRLALDAEIDTDLDSATLGFNVLRRDLEPALTLLADTVRNATYPQDDVEWQKKIAADAREKSAGDTDFAPRAVAAAFGPQHPLGAGLGTAANIRAVSAKDVRDFHDRYWTPDAAALILAGDITLEDAVRLATSGFGTWSGTAAEQPKLPPPAPMPGRLFLADRRGAAQTMLAQIVPGVPLTSPDYPAMLVVADVLGRITESRLRVNIRQQRGIAYYTLSTVATFPEYGLWESYSHVQTDSTGLAIGEFQKELAALGAAKPITAAEFEVAKGGIIRALPGNYETVWSAAQQVASNWVSGLPPDADDLLASRIAALTLDEVNAATRKYANADRAIFILIGDREKIEPQLRTLNLGPITAIQ